jgi:hypothetical protein
MNTELEWMWKEAILTWLKDYSGMYREGLNNTTKNPNLNRKCFRWICPSQIQTGSVTGRTAWPGPWFYLQFFSASAAPERLPIESEPSWQYRGADIFISAIGVFGISLQPDYKGVYVGHTASLHTDNSDVSCHPPAIYPRRFWKLVLFLWGVMKWGCYIVRPLNRDSSMVWHVAMFRMENVGF